MVPVAKVATLKPCVRMELRGRIMAEAHRRGAGLFSLGIGEVEHLLLEVVDGGERNGYREFLSCVLDVLKADGYGPRSHRKGGVLGRYKMKAVTEGPEGNYRYS